VQITIDEKERDLLKKVLDQYFSELREEIYKTEGHEFKVQLKDEETRIKQLIDKLAG
jgi:hypothetical protein